MNDSATATERSAAFRIHDLPPEIFIEIIHHCLEYHAVVNSIFDVCEDMPSILDTRTDLWAFSHVCALWRSCILGQADLWSTIIVSTSVLELGDKRKRLSEVASLVLERSGECPLTIFFGDILGYGSGDDLIRQLLSSSRRWRNVEMRLGFGPYPVLGALKGNVPMLERLSIDVCDLDGRFCDAPRLREVELNWQYCDDVSIEDQLPWAQLTSLRVKEMPELLARFGGVPAEIRSAATHGGFTFSGSPSLEITNPDIFYFPSLTTLDAKWITIEELSSLCLPSLKCIRLPPCPSGIWEFLDLSGELRSLISRSKCTLTYIKLEVEHFAPEVPPELCLLLQAIPDLFDLHLIFKNDPKTMVDILDTCLRTLPRLKNLFISFKPDEKLLPQDLHHMTETLANATWFRHHSQSEDLSLVICPLQHLEVTLTLIKDSEQEHPSVEELYNPFYHTDVGYVPPQIAFYVKRRAIPSANEKQQVSNEVE